MIEEPLTAAGPVRGEAYDRRRFALRQFICTSCGTLVDVQVGLERGSPELRGSADRSAASAPVGKREPVS